MPVYVTYNHEKKAGYNWSLYSLHPYRTKLCDKDASIPIHSHFTWTIASPKMKDESNWSLQNLHNDILQWHIYLYNWSICISHTPRQISTDWVVINYKKHLPDGLLHAKFADLLLTFDTVRTSNPAGMASGVLAMTGGLCVEPARFDASITYE